MANTHVIKAKCMSCSLHFAAYSDNEEWHPAFCPECGADEPFLIWRDTSDLFIFEHVPGSTPLASMS